MRNDDVIGQCPKCHMTLPQCICKSVLNYMQTNPKDDYWNDLHSMRAYFSLVSKLDKDVIVQRIDNTINLGYKLINTKEDTYIKKVDIPKPTITPYVCPVCKGNGLVPNGFYNQVSGNWSTFNATPEQCRSCKGSGIVWSKGEI